MAQIVLDEMAPGSMAWLKWRNVLHVVDLVCCCSILFPIIWSIRHLRQVRGIVVQKQIPYRICPPPRPNDRFSPANCSMVNLGGGRFWSHSPESGYPNMMTALPLLYFLFCSRFVMWSKSACFHELSLSAPKDSVPCGKREGGRYFLR